MSELKSDNSSVNHGKKEKSSNNNYNNEAFNFSSFQQNNNLKNKRAVNKINKIKQKKLKINSISDLEFHYNDSQNKYSMTNIYVKLKNKNLINSSTNIDNISTEIISIKKDNHPRYNKSKPNFDDFWKSVQDNEKKRKEKINNLKAQSIIIEKHLIKKNSYISKKSLSLANLKKRAPLHLNKSLNEEHLEKDFMKFYKNNLNLTCKDETRIDNEEKIKGKFNKFYEDNIIWKKNKNDNLANTRNKMKQQNKVEYSFKPDIDKNSILLVKKMEKINSMDLKPYNNLNNYEFENELLDQLKLKLKPILGQYFDYNNKKVPFVNKRSIYLLRNSANKNKAQKLNKSKSLQKLSYVDIDKNNKEIQNATKKEKKNKNKDIIKKPKHPDINKKMYENYLLNKFKELEKLSRKNKKELYKLNVRQATSWNPGFVNKIISKKKYSHIIDNLIEN